MIGAAAGCQGEQHGEGMRAFWRAAVGLSLPEAGCLLEPCVWWSSSGKLLLSHALSAVPQTR